MLRVERVFPDLAEKLAVLVDAVASFRIDHHREAVVAVFFSEVGPVLGEDVRVGVDLERVGFRHAWILRLYRCAGANSLTLPTIGVCRICAERRRATRVVAASRCGFDVSFGTSIVSRGPSMSHARAVALKSAPRIRALICRAPLTILGAG